MNKPQIKIIEEIVENLKKRVDDESLSLRSMDFIQFTDKVMVHFDVYTIPQYGDKGEDLCTNYTVEECLRQAEKYIKRYGKNSREGQQELDFFKAAHFIQMAYEKYTQLQNEVKP